MFLAPKGGWFIYLFFIYIPYFRGGGAKVWKFPYFFLTLPFVSYCKMLRYSSS